MSYQSTFLALYFFYVSNSLAQDGYVQNNNLHVCHFIFSVWQYIEIDRTRLDIV